MVDIIDVLKSIKDAGPDGIDPSNNDAAPAPTPLIGSTPQSNIIDAPKFPAPSSTDEYQLRKDERQKLHDKLSDPDRQQAYNDKIKGNPFENIMNVIGNIAAYTPRGGRIGNLITGSIAGGKKQAADALAADADQLNKLGTAGREDEEQQNKNAAEGREAEKWGFEKPGLQAATDVNSPLSQYTQKTNSKVNPDLVDLANQIPAAQWKDMGANIQQSRSAAEAQDNLKESIAVRKATQQETMRHNQEMENQKTAVQGGVGQKAVDKKVGEDYASWGPGGGSSTLESGINTLEQAKALIKANPGVSGSVIGILPRGARASLNPTAGQVEQMVEGAVIPTMKALFGRVLSTEFNRTIENTYNPRLPAEANIEGLQRLQDRFMSLGKAKQESMDYFQKNGSMEGYTGKVYNPSDLISGDAPSKGSATQTSGSTTSAPQGVQKTGAPSQDANSRVMGGVPYEKRSNGKWYPKGQ